MSSSGNDRHFIESVSTSDVGFQVRDEMGRLEGGVILCHQGGIVITGDVGRHTGGATAEGELSSAGWCFRRGLSLSESRKENFP